jgi:hypothetical protein
VSEAKKSSNRWIGVAAGIGSAGCSLIRKDEKLTGLAWFTQRFDRKSTALPTLERRRKVVWYFPARLRESALRKLGFGSKDIS